MPSRLALSATVRMHIPEAQRQLEAALRLKPSPAIAEYIQRALAALVLVNAAGEDAFVKGQRALKNQSGRPSSL